MTYDDRQAHAAGQTMRRPMFSALRPAVEEVLQTYAVDQTAQFGQLIRDELAHIAHVDPHRSPDQKHLHDLYELRARMLDWELGTGYLGYFSQNPGTRYTFTKRLEAVVQMLPVPLQPDQTASHSWRVLEIGCGAGMLCLELARKAEWVVGIDVSHFVLNFANRVKHAVGYTNVAFQQGDAERLAFPDNSFDVVICSEVLEHLLDPQHALTEIRRVLKHNGTCILTTPCAVSLSDLCVSGLRVFHRHLESEKDLQFDKKTYLAVKRRHLTEGQAAEQMTQAVTDDTFMRIHTRFRYRDLVVMLHRTGFEIDQTVGTVFAFPPHYQVFYRYCPGFLLTGVRGLEWILNQLHIFPRWGAVTTCFRVHPTS
jgi:ubiquinone biosynthesis O-methyltransferase